MKLWQVRFGRHLIRAVDAAPVPRWTLGQWIGVAARQAGLQATGWIALPLAALIMLPLAWVYAFYQNLTVMDGPAVRDVKFLVAEAKAQAMRNPGQNHVLLLAMTLFGHVVLANTAVVLILAPQLLQRLLGIETIFALSGFHLLNTTFLAVILSLTYLFIDPIIKAAYGLRCYAGRARRTGDDILSGLKTYTAAMVLFLAALVTVEAFPARAAQPTEVPAAAGEASTPPGYVRELDQAIDGVLQQRKFAWRLARETIEAEPETKTWLDRTLDWLIDGIAATVRSMDRWLERFWQWVTERMPKSEKSPDSADGDWRNLIKIGFCLIGAALLVWMLWWFKNRQMMRRRERKGHQRPVDVRPMDLADESITARDLPVDQWLALAAEMLAQEDLRRALRALYLALLAALADEGGLTIARHKTNQDYYAELARRQHDTPEVLTLFDRCRRAYDRVWYGMHAVSATQVAQFKSHQERILELVRPAP